MIIKKIFFISFFLIVLFSLDLRAVASDNSMTTPSENIRPQKKKISFWKTWKEFKKEFKQKRKGDCV